MSKEPTIVEDYLALTKTYQSKYGQQTILLMQVGAFYEVYGLKNTNVSEIMEFSHICQLNVSEKKLTVADQTVIMAGFRDYSLEKYLQKLTDANYTAVVYIQEIIDKVIRRVLKEIHSPGTYLSYETDTPQTTNNIMCIWLEHYQKKIIYGVAVVNIFTGKSSLFEYETQFIMNPTSFDELERYISVFQPNEVIIIHSLTEREIHQVIQFSGIKTNKIHYALTSDKKTENCTKQKYIKHILCTFFGEDTYDVCSEFNLYSMATQSFCYLLNFIQEHNPNLVRKIAIPTFNNTSDRLVLANHTLKQLNIIDDMSNDGKRIGQLSSVSSLLNKCCTAMGKRKLYEQITNPTSNETWLNSEYEMTALMLDNYYFIDNFRRQLTNIRDIEKICRQLLVVRVLPSIIYQLYKSIQIIQQINTCLFEHPVISLYLCEISGYIQETTTALISFFEQNLFMDACKNISSMQNFETNIIQREMCPELDAAVDSHQALMNAFESIHQSLNTLTDSTDFIKIHETDKMGFSLQITRKRGLALKTIIAARLKTNPDDAIVFANYTLFIKDLKFTPTAGTTDEINCPVITSICKDIYIYKERMNHAISAAYLNFLSQLEQHWFSHLENMAKYVANIDVLQCKTYNARFYNYCRPAIISAEASCVNARDLRHCLIEHIQKNEIYVANDLDIGTSGILLYGTNAVGKTSLIRALGIAVILAQCGMYVPCSSFHYKPYTAIFSRILGNDNIFKGLSTFAVEMSELRIILKMADSCSLILGDELCSGTETESALSIFVAGLTDLHRKRTSFIFATHFHEIVKYDEIKVLNNLKLKHMSVIYDRANDCLIYDRKMKDGVGNRMYGLEVCKSLYLPDDFLESAYAIRNKYYPETRGDLSQPITTYNASKIRGMCELCNASVGTETHHLQYQQNANVDGFIGTFHKNHPANLIAVCEACHTKFHDASGVELKRKKTTSGYIII